jgi:hemoglobin
LQFIQLEICILKILKEKQMSESTTEATLYERIGGEVAISAAVDMFYERVLADPQLNGFFKNTSMARLKAHQHAFLSQALGGPRSYSGASMKDAHRNLAIEQRHFDAVAGHLVGTLRTLGIDDDIVAQVAGAVTPLSDQVVNTNRAT